MNEVEFVRWCQENESRLVLSTRRDFYERIERDAIDRYERLEFHLVIHCTGGTGEHRVDFDAVQLVPNTALYIQPGQVHQLSTGSRAEYDAHYVAFLSAPTAPLPIPVGPNLVTLDAARRCRLELLYELTRARADSRTSDVVASEDAGLRDLLYVTFGFSDLDQVPTPSAASHPNWAVEAFGALRTDLENVLRAGETVQNRADRLGFSTRTLDRACQALTGSTAKRVCDERLSLEARRLLSLPNASASRVAQHLQFTEPTNFAKFMKRTTGETPSALLAA